MKHLVVFLITMAICWVFYCIIHLESSSSNEEVANESIEFTYDETNTENEVYTFTTLDH